MSKKKKFPGKKTKLAEHALTQALEKEKSEAADPLEVPDASSTLAQVVQALRNDQLHLDLPAGEAHPILTRHQVETANTYLAMVQELKGMRELLRAPSLPARTRTIEQKSGKFPTPEIVNYSLQVIGKTLREIRAIMG
jgi:hypothetical protein